MRPLAIALTAFTLASHVTAAEWVALGPTGGTVTAITASPLEPVLYAGTQEGHLFRMADGKRWERVGSNLPARKIKRILLSTWDAPRLWVLNDRDLYRSSDRGNSFLLRLAGPVSSVAVAPAHPSIVYAVAKSTIRKSVDGGITWTTLPGIGADLTPVTVAVDAADPSSVYVHGALAPLYNSVLLRSRDGGTTWQRLTLPPNLIREVIADPKREGIAVIQGDSGTYRTSDGGESWAYVPFTVGSVAFDPTGFVVADNFGHVRRCDDDGSVRELAPTGRAMSIAVDPMLPQRLLAGLQIDGVKMSPDGGATWLPFNDGLTASEIIDLATTPANRDLVYAASAGHVYRSTDRGATWTIPGDPGGGLTQLAVDPVDWNDVWVGNRWDVWRSRDAGATWQRAAQFIGRLQPQNQVNDTMVGLAFEPAPSAALWVAMSGMAFGGAWGEVYRSVDGKTFTDVTPPGLTYGDLFESLAVGAGSVWIGGRHFYSVPLLLRSSDGGATWSDVSAKFIAAEGRSRFVRGVFTNPLNRRSVFVATLSGVEQRADLFRSDDDGENWRACEDGLPAAAAVTSIVLKRGFLYASTSEGVFLSGDGGESWRSASLDEPAAMLAADDELYAATAGAGVFRLAADPPFVVTTANDSGAGSLREAIEVINLSNASVVTIAFTDSFTVKPATPLPPIAAAAVTIDAKEQSVTLDGSLTTGSGLELRCGGSVRGLTIVNFAEAGIVTTPGGPVCSGLIIEHNVLARNGRGVVGAPFVGTIRNNVIKDNRRSGIFVSSGALSVHRNEIRANGASGVYLGPSVSNSEVLENTILSNRDMGIAVDRAATLIDMRQNVIGHSGGLGIDIGLDGPNDPLADDANGKPPNAPRLLDAHYDAATGTTIVTGMLHSAIGGGYFNNHMIELYANASDDAEAEELIGWAYPQGESFTFRVARNLAGRWITAAQTRTYWFAAKPPGGDSFGGGYSATSELSNGVEVMP